MRRCLRRWSFNETGRREADADCDGHILVKLRIMMECVCGRRELLDDAVLGFRADSMIT